MRIATFIHSMVTDDVKMVLMPLFYWIDESRSTQHLRFDRIQWDDVILQATPLHVQVWLLLMICCCFGDDATTIYTSIHNLHAILNI